MHSNFSPYYMKYTSFHSTLVDFQYSFPPKVSAEVLINQLLLSPSPHLCHPPHLITSTFLDKFTQCQLFININNCTSSTAPLRSPPMLYTCSPPSSQSHFICYTDSFHHLHSQQLSCWNKILVANKLSLLSLVQNPSPEPLNTSRTLSSHTWKLELILHLVHLWITHPPRHRSSLLSPGWSISSR